MPSSKNYVRDLKQEAKTATARGDDTKNKNRKQAERTYEKARGKCSGDVDHKNRSTSNNSLSNLRCVPASKNRSIDRKGQGKKYDTSKKRG
jgi:hypothetical protein